MGAQLQSPSRPHCTRRPTTCQRRPKIDPFPTSTRTHGLGQLVKVGIEGPGHYGAGLARYLRAEGIAVTEVGRPKGQRRARYGKSDDTDTAGAAAIVLAGEAVG